MATPSDLPWYERTKGRVVTALVTASFQQHHLPHGCHQDGLISLQGQQLGEYMRFQVLGPLAVVDEQNGDITPSARKLRTILALLLMRNQRLVHVHELTDELWGISPPRSALPTLQTYVYRLRRCLFGGEGPGEKALRTMPLGYLLAIPRDDVDASRFEALATEGKAALSAHDPARATSLLGEALSIWRGAPLAGVPAGELLSAQINTLEEHRLRAVELRIEADLQLDRHHELVMELKALCAAHSLHEGLHAKLMVALSRSGRRYEALALYQTFRARTIEELGIEPSAMLGKLQQAILTADAAMEHFPGTLPAPRPDRVALLVPEAAAAARDAGTPGPPARPAAPGRLLPCVAAVPAQLPPKAAVFCGRQLLLARLTRWLSTAHDPALPTQVVWVTGMPGVGKTAFALELAHQVRDQFPDGQLFASLGGATGELAKPTGILGRFAAAVGVDPAVLPDDQDVRCGMFRTWAAGKRLLIVLDDAAGLDQVVPLVPGHGSCVLIVTSRAQAAAGVKRVALDPLPPGESVELLAALLGRRRVAQAQPAAEQVAQLCEGLPLALHAAAAQMAVFPLERFAQFLDESSDRLCVLSFPGLDVRAAFEASCRYLTGQERAAVRLISQMPRGEVTVRSLAAALGCPAPAAEALLARLAQRFLLRVARHDERQVAFHMPGLVKMYAREELTEGPQAAGHGRPEPASP